MLSVQTVEKFKKIVASGIEESLAGNLSMNKYVLFYIVNNYVDIRGWIDDLSIVEKPPFERMIFELGDTYENYAMLDKIRRFASNLSVCKYVCISQVKEKYGTIRIYVDRTADYYEVLDDESIDSTQIIRDCETFDRYVEDIEDFATRSWGFTEKIHRLYGYQYKYSNLETALAGILAINNGIFSAGAITPNVFFDISDIMLGMNELEESGFNTNERDCLPPTQEMFDGITNAINAMKVR